MFLAPVFASLLPHNLSALPQSAATTAVAALWQGIVIAAALALCLRLMPRISAAHRFVAWSVTFFALVSLPFAAGLAGLFHSSAVSSGPGSTSHSAFFQLDPRWSLLIAAVWLLASGVRFAGLLLHTLRLRRLWRSASPLEIPASLQFAGRIPVCSTQDLDRPSVIGFFAPRILIPHWLCARLTPGELEHIVLHESEHLRRRDDWTNLLQKLCLVVYPLNPALWWIDRHLGKEREMACDEGVIRITQAPRAYAACLASLAERGLNRRAQALSLGAWQRRPELARRVHSILRGTRTLHPLAARALVSTLGCGLLIATVELARCPELVAFVPQQPAHARTTAHRAGNTDGQVIDAAYSGPYRRAAMPYRAVEARAILPAVTVTHAPAVRERAPRTDAHPVLTAARHSAAAPLHAQQLVASTPSAKPAPASSEQWIVFTEWEEVVTSSARTPAAADYDTARSDATQPAAAPAAKDNAPADKLSSRTNVTRLIFRVLPENSKSGRPRAIPLPNGWLVIQL